jgi:tetratricopeptide (TPR) repeat protein
MVHLCLRVGLLIVASGLCFAQTSTVAPISGQNPPQLPTLGPQLPPPLLIAPEPPPLPSLPDAPLPDLATLTSPPPKSPIKRKLSELIPRCIDGVAHTCWSSPLGDEPANVSQADREFAKDVEVGDFYFKRKNYRAAADRYKEALVYKPNDALVNFRAAQCLEKLKQPEEARVHYEQYLKTLPHGPLAPEAEKALDKLGTDRKN